MIWPKDALFERAPELTISLERSGRLSIVHGGQAYRGDHCTLRILEVFASPVTMQQALDSLRPSMPGFAAFTDLMDQVRGLVAHGIIVDMNKTDGGLTIGLHDSQFDSFPVHIRMLNDVARTRAYQEAIRKTVRPDDTVLEIGTGTGVLTATAALAGARHVYTIERTAIARLARQIFETNGIVDRITQVDETSFRAELPERATVLVSEIIGNDPFAEDIRRTTRDAVERLLTPDARLLPERIRIVGLPVTVPQSEISRHMVVPELAASWKRMYDIDFGPMVAAATSKDQLFSIRPQEAKGWARVADAIVLLDLDLRTAESIDIETTHRLVASRGGLLNGVLVYFEALLGPAGWLSTAPDTVSDDNHWRSHVWVPAQPCTLRPGESRDLTYVLKSNKSSFRLNEPSGA